MMYPGDYWWVRWEEETGMPVPKVLHINHSGRKTREAKYRTKRERERRRTANDILLGIRRVPNSNNTADDNGTYE
jgi:hypothetical protein